MLNISEAAPTGPEANTQESPFPPPISVAHTEEEYAHHPSDQHALIPLQKLG